MEPWLQDGTPTGAQYSIGFARPGVSMAESRQGSAWLNTRISGYPGEYWIRLTLRRTGGTATPGVDFDGVPSGEFTCEVGKASGAKLCRIPFNMKYSPDYGAVETVIFQITGISACQLDYTNPSSSFTTCPGMSIAASRNTYTLRITP